MSKKISFSFKAKKLHLVSTTIRSEPKSWFSSGCALATKKAPENGGFFMAASPGLEPRLTESESAVLPLDDEAIIQTTLNIYAFFFHLSNDLLRSGTKKSPLAKLYFSCSNKYRGRLFFL